MLDHLISQYGLHWVVGIVLFFTVFYVIRVMYAVREGIEWFFRSLLVGIVVGVVAMVVLQATKVPKTDLWIWGTLAGFASMAFTPKRSRYIPAEIKKQVITRDLKGKKYNPKKQHVDHIWPHCKGGSNTPDNLRVIEKKRNLKKGARKPGLKDWL